MLNRLIRQSIMQNEHASRSRAEGDSSPLSLSEKRFALTVKADAAPLSPVPPQFTCGGRRHLEHGKR